MRYVATKGDDQQRVELNSIESLQGHFFQLVFGNQITFPMNDTSLKGELYFLDHANLKVTYDLIDGEIDIKDIKAMPGVFNRYPRTPIFHDYYEPIHTAMQWLAKLAFIHLIYTQGDRKINDIIVQSGVIDSVTHKLSENINLNKLNGLLIKIYNEVCPEATGLQHLLQLFQPKPSSNTARTDMQLAMYDVFSEMGLTGTNIVDKILSLKDVNDCCDKMKNRLEPQKLNL